MSDADSFKDFEMIGPKEDDSNCTSDQSHRESPEQGGHELEARAQSHSSSPYSFAAFEAFSSQLPTSPPCPQTNLAYPRHLQTDTAFFSGKLEDFHSSLASWVNAKRPAGSGQQSQATLTGFVEQARLALNPYLQSSMDVDWWEWSERQLTDELRLSEDQQDRLTNEAQTTFDFIRQTVTGRPAQPNSQ
jgi:hypothetical protein